MLEFGAASARPHRELTSLNAPDQDLDRQLIAGIARAEQDALSALYDRYSGLVLAVCTRMLKDRRRAEDLTHDLFLEVWNKAGTYDPARASVRTWLLVRTRSRALDRLRSAGYSRVTPVGDDPIGDKEAAPESSSPDRAPDQRAVRAAVAALPEKLRAVLELAYFEGLSSSEIGARLGVPTGTVKSRTRAALQELRAAFGAGAPRRSP